MPRCNLTSDSGAIVVQTPYDSAWVAEFKSLIPQSDRRPRKDGKQFYWLVTPQHGKTVQDLCMKYFNELPLLPNVANVKPTIKQQILEIRYIGATKDRGGDERSAYGWRQKTLWHETGWNVVFSESVLRAWFDAPAVPDEQPNLYSVLVVSRSATDDEIKSGYRRMARQWHPDACKEPNAHEQFLAIQHAYEVLTKNRERYDAGLAFEMSLRNNPNGNSRFDNVYIAVNGYRSPLRCGLIMCEGIEQMGIFQVSKIFAWQDIHDVLGRVLVVSWGKGDDKFSEVWA